MNKDSSKVFLMIASYAESLIIFRSSLITDLVNRGLSVHVAAPDITSEISQEIIKLGAIPHVIKLQRNGLNPVVDLLTLISINKLIHSLRPRRVLAYTIKPVVYSGLICRLYQKTEFYPMITGLGYAFGGNSGFKSKFASVVAKSLFKSGLHNSTCTIFQNPDDKEVFLLSKILPETARTRVVNGSGVDTKKFKVSKIRDGEACFLLIARLLSEKGIREYVEAARTIKKQHPEVRFLLVGWLDTNPTAITESELAKWTNEGSIEFLGRLSDVRPAIELSTVYVLPSYREGTPRTVLEAMSMGRAIITTNAPGCRETVIDNVNGYLISVKSVDELVEKMLIFINNSEIAKVMGRESRKLAESRYDVEKVNNSMLNCMGL